MFTVTFGTTAPLGSVTVPPIEPEPACEKANPGTNKTAAHRLGNVLIDFLRPQLGLTLIHLDLFNEAPGCYESTSFMQSTSIKIA
jgi:hypothetical protein